MTAELRQFATVDIGVVTGRNEFFVLAKDGVLEKGLEAHCMPVVGRSRQLEGAVFRAQDHAALAMEGQGVYLFTYDPLLSPELPPEARAYILEGESTGFHRGYKCSIRDPWYSVPGVWVPDYFMFRQIHDFPRVALNGARATSTDTIHRMRCLGEPGRFLASYYTHLTAASSEIEGRSYGGGVLELEPTEAERILMPSSLLEGLPVQEMDKLIRQARTEDVLAEHDRLILMQGMGLSARECRMLRRIWVKMRDRRHTRKRKRRAT